MSRFAGLVSTVTLDQQVPCIYRTAILRRHLTDDQRAVLAARYEQLLGREAKSERAKAADSLQDTPSDKLSGDQPKPRRSPSSRQKAAALHNVPERKVRAAGELDRQDPALGDQVLAGGPTLSQASRTLKARKSAGVAAGKSAEPPADARGQGASKSKARPKDAIGSSSGEFRTLTRALDKADAALAGAESKFSKAASRLTGEARKKLETRLGKLRSRLDGLLKLVAGEVG